MIIREHNNYHKRIIQVKEKYKTYLYYALFPHKIITWKQIHDNNKKVKNTLQPQLIDGNTALQYINNVLPSKSNIYPISKEDCDKVNQLNIIHSISMIL